jgi:formate dehydrogenase subunit delta
MTSDGNTAHESTAAAAGPEPAADPGAPQTPASLVRMANQIASNVAHKPHDVAVEQTAGHLREFWPPSMRASLQAFLDAGGTGLDPIAREALSRVR